MKFVCEKNALQREIAVAQEVIASKQLMSILSNIYLEAKDETLTIRSTDSQVNFETKIPVSVIEPGDTTVLGDKFLAILNTEADGEIEIAQDGMNVVIKSRVRKSKHTLKTNSSEKFPPLPFGTEETFFALPVKEFKEMIGRVIFAVSDEVTRYFMNGVYMEKLDGKLIMVATDGRRMAYVEKDGSAVTVDFKGVIIPVKPLSVIQKHAGDEGEISVAVTEGVVFFKFGSYNISSQLIEGNFPNYRRVIPENQEHSLVVNRVDMLGALRTILPLALDKKQNRIHLAMNGDALTLSSEDNDIGYAEDEISCQYNWDESRISLNYRYIDEPLKNMESEDFGIYFTDPTKALTVKPVPEADYFHIVMPMQDS